MTTTLDAFAMWLRATDVSQAITAEAWLWPACEMVHFVALSILVGVVGFFVVPAMLGGPRDILLAQLIEFNVNQTLNWPFAGALSAVLLVSTLALYWLGDLFLGLRRLWGAE